MSSVDDCASQEIEVCTSSASTIDSRKHSFVQSFLNIDRSQYIPGDQGIVFNDTNPILPLDKHEYIQNWILTHNNIENSPQKIHHASPVLSTIRSNSHAKRVADSRVQNYQSKRVCRDINSKENYGVYLNGQSRQTINELLAAQRTVAINNESLRDQRPTDFLNVSNTDSDKTCMNSPVLNGNTNTSTLNASRTMCKIAADRLMNGNRRESGGSSIISESISYSSPFRGSKSSEVDNGSTKQSQCERRNGTKLIESEPKRAYKNNDRWNLNHDTPKLWPRSSPSSSTGWIKDTSAKKNSLIDEQNRLSRRLSCLRENTPIRIESRSTSTNSNHQNLVRHSSNLLDTLSISSPIGDSDRIEVESSTTNPGEDEMKIESDSDDAGSFSIQNIETQYHLPTSHKNICNIEDPSQVFVERGSKRPRDLSCDSDETYYSDGDSASRLQTSEPSTLKNSQKISQDKSDIVISQVPSPLINNSAYVAPVNTPNGNNQKKKKAKKGSLLAKLQNLVSLQVSGLRIWKHQMSQPGFKQSCTLFVTFRVRDRETRWGRHYITASVIADASSLLKDLSASQTSSTSQNNASFGNQTLTLMIVPEVTGIVKIRADSSLNVYPPWDIIDRDRRILNITHFDVVANVDNADASGTVKIRMIERIIQKFDCPCIQAGAIVDSCFDKFTERKPSVMRALFES